MDEEQKSTKTEKQHLKTVEKRKEINIKKFLLNSIVNYLRFECQEAINSKNLSLICDKVKLSITSSKR